MADSNSRLITGIVHGLFLSQLSGSGTGAIGKLSSNARKLTEEFLSPLSDPSFRCKKSQDDNQTHFLSSDLFQSGPNNRIQQDYMRN